MSSVINAVPGSASTKPLYRKLRPRPNGPPRDDIVANQRARLHGAMIEATAARGYERTSVAELCRLAGISKRTFYEQYENKEDCYLASFERVVSCAVGAVARELPPDAPWERQLTVALHALAADVAERPKAARLVLLEAPAAGPVGVARLDSLRLEIEQVVEAGFASTQPSGRCPASIAKGIVCGLERVIRKALAADRMHEPARLAEALTQWALTYAATDLESLPATAPPPSEAAVKAREHSAGRLLSRRARILRTAAEIAAVDGYERLSLSAVSRRSGVDEATVLAYYDSPDACFLDAVDLLGLEAVITAVETSRSAGDGVQGVCMGIAALMDRLAGDSVMRGAIFTERALAGSAAAQRGESRLYGVAGVLLARIPNTEEQPWVVSEATIGAVWGVISHHVLRGSTAMLPEISGHIAYLALAPVVGAEALAAALCGDFDEVA